MVVAATAADDVVDRFAWTARQDVGLESPGVGGGAHGADRAADDRVLGGIVGSMIIALYMPIFKVFELIG